MNKKKLVLLASIGWNSPSRMQSHFASRSPSFRAAPRRAPGETGTCSVSEKEMEKAQVEVEKEEEINESKACSSSIDPSLHRNQEKATLTRRPRALCTRPRASRRSAHRRRSRAARALLFELKREEQRCSSPSLMRRRHQFSLPFSAIRSSEGACSAGEFDAE